MTEQQLIEALTSGQKVYYLREDKCIPSYILAYAPIEQQVKLRPIVSLEEAIALGLSFSIITGGKPLTSFAFDNIIASFNPDRFTLEVSAP